MKESYAIAVNNRFQILTGDLEQEGHARTVEEEWKDIKQVLKDAAKEVLPTKSKQAKQPWMTQEILDMMKERKKKKNTPAEYRRINKDILNKCKEAKEVWMKQQCEEMEELQRRHNLQGAHRKIKEITGKQRRKKNNVCLKDESGKVLFDIESVSKR